MSLRIGWIGCGKHAEQMLLPQLVRLDARLAAVVDVNPEAARRIADRYGVARVYADHRAMLADGGLDAVAMAVGPGQHRVMAVDALSAGLPVFMEKPPGATMADAEAIHKAATVAGRPVAVGFMKRYATGNRIAANLLSTGRFGRVAGFLGEYMTAPTYFEGDPDYTGFFLHHCIHYMDLVRHFCGDVENLDVRTAEMAPGRLLLHVHFAFTSGAIGTLVMGTIQSRGNPVERIELMGDHRRIDVDNVIEVRFYRDPPFKADDMRASLDDAEDALFWRPNFTAAANEDHKGYHALLADVLPLLRGEVSAAPTIADGVAAMRLLEQVRMIAGR